MLEKRNGEKLLWVAARWKGKARARVNSASLFRYSERMGRFWLRRVITLQFLLLRICITAYHRSIWFQILPQKDSAWSVYLSDCVCKEFHFRPHSESQMWIDWLVMSSLNAASLRKPNLKIRSPFWNWFSMVFLCLILHFQLYKAVYALLHKDNKGSWRSGSASDSSAIETDSRRPLVRPQHFPLLFLFDTLLLYGSQESPWWFSPFLASVSTVVAWI